MQKTLASLATLLALTFFAASSHAEKKVDADLKLEWDVPAGWKVDTTGNATIMQDPTGDTMIMLVKTTETNQQKVADGVDAWLGQAMKDIKYPEKPTVGKTNELKSIQARMTATYEGKPVKGVMRILETPNKKYLIIGAVALASKYEELKGPINVFLKSIKAVK